MPKLDNPGTRATMVARRTSPGGSSFGAREGAFMPPAERSTAHADRDDRERQKAVELALGQIEKQFGKGSIMRLGQKGPIQPIDAIPTGAISIDYALGVGGVPRGRVIEIFGPESSGKTTLALQV